MSRLLRRLPVDARPLLLLACLLGGVLWTLQRYGADGVGGADSAGYLAQAVRWRTGGLVRPLPLPDLPSPDAAWLQSPLGFRPSPSGTATVPTYPPGWPVLLAVALSFGDAFAIRVLPALCAIAALAALYVVGQRVMPPWHALGAVASLASSAPFLFQASQPMSDVPALAAWLVGFAGVTAGTRRGLALGSLSVGLAILIRPNLFPLLIAIGWAAASAPWSAERSVSRSGSPTRRVLAACVPGLVAVATYAAWQAMLYGAPWQSGYGSANELFALGHAPVNARHYAAWIGQALGLPMVVLGAVGAVWLVAARLPRALLGAVALGCALYLVYVPFDDWTYLRFVLLPLALLTLAGWAALARATRRLGVARPVVAIVVGALVSWANAQRLAPLGVLEMHRHEARFAAAARFLRQQPDPRLVVMAAHHSGAVAAYGGLPVVRLDLLSHDAAPDVLTWLLIHDHSLAIVLDDHELADVRERLGEAGLTLDWPPRARVGRPGRTSVWFLADARRYREGRPVPTTPLWPERR